MGYLRANVAMVFSLLLVLHVSRDGVRYHSLDEFRGDTVMSNCCLCLT